MKNSKRSNTFAHSGYHKVQQLPGVQLHGIYEMQSC